MIKLCVIFLIILLICYLEMGYTIFAKKMQNFFDISYFQSIYIYTYLKYLFCWLALFEVALIERFKVKVLNPEIGWIKNN